MYVVSPVPFSLSLPTPDSPLVPSGWFHFHSVHTWMISWLSIKVSCSLATENMYFVFFEITLIYLTGPNSSFIIKKWCLKEICYSAFVVTCRRLISYCVPKTWKEWGLLWWNREMKSFGPSERRPVPIRFWSSFASPHPILCLPFLV